MSGPGCGRGDAEPEAGVIAGARGCRGRPALDGRGAGGAEARAETAQVPRAASEAGEWLGHGLEEEGTTARQAPGRGVPGPEDLGGGRVRRSL